MTPLPTRPHSRPNFPSTEGGGAWTSKLTGDRLPITAGNYEGEGVRSGAGLCHGAHVSFISPQDHARNRLIHDLYAQRKGARAVI